MSDSPTAVERLVADQEKRQREHTALNAAPLSAITPDALDAAIAAAQSAGLWERHSALNGRKLRDLHDRMDPATGAILPRREDTGVTDVTSLAPAPRKSPDELRAELAVIDAEIADHKRNVRQGSIPRLQQLRQQHAAVMGELRVMKGAYDMRGTY
jgi:hypothetical protein